ncbi:MAG TPA: hypothetical protein VHO70_01770 [Chitinispirillaceae bacterium]|nr:hypothetical protein [Chitinispirillaceae bacterium]
MDILITIDYELFGNGTGDVKSHMIEPTQKLMSLGERYNVPITFFVEVEEFLAFERYATELTGILGYNPADLIRNQIIDMIRRGHDVQLHIHPQWKDAHLENGIWVLDRNATSIDALFSKEDEAVQYVKARKNVLEKLFETIDPGRKVSAFRAGAFCAQPGKLLIPALCQNGIKFESSVVNGLYRTHGQGELDYRYAPVANSWRVKEDVAVEDPSGTLTEIPIGSRMQWRFQQLSYGRIKAKFSRKVPREKQQETLKEIGVSKNPLSVIRFLLKKAPTKFDIHNVEARTLLKLIKSSCHLKDNPQTVVLIGHTKEHLSDNNVENFLGSIQKNSGLRPVTFNKLLTD